MAGIFDGDHTRYTKMPTDFQQQRRTVLKLGVAAGGSFVLNCMSTDAGAVTSEPVPFQPNAWIRIDADGSTTIVVAESEMGQGVLTSMSILVAEELEVDWRRVTVRQAPADPAYGWQGTGGSTSVRHGWRPLREAGAAARMMLQAAAARKWRVPPDACRASSSEIIHDASGRRASYGELAELAAREPVPKVIRLKEPSGFRLIGKSLPRLDTPSKVNGQAVFGADVRRPGMLYAAILHCPVLRGKVKRVESRPALGMAGVRHVVPLESAVATVGDSFWQAKQALQRLVVEWDLGANSTQSTENIGRMLREALQRPGDVILARDASEPVKSPVVRHVEAVYETPYQAHATMEPMCCTADVCADRCTLWAPTQQPTGLQQEVARFLTGQRDPGREALQRVTVHTTLLGGGFGRRNLHDFALEAVQISRAVKAPVKLVWSREEDMQHDYYHPATAHRLRAALDRRGRLLSWEHRLAGSPHTGGAADLPYTVASQRLEAIKVATGIPAGPWRSVSHAYTAYAVECFIDELAAATGKDPYVYRAEHMHDRRLRAVLDLAATRVGWGKARPIGRHFGIAAHASFGSYVAQVVELSVDGGGAIRVHRVVCVVDCGIVVNPDTVVAQIEGSVVYGLTAALKGQITIWDGRAVQSNFHDYPLLRMDETPQIDVHVVPSNESPGGIGEPGVPPLAPALANAVYAATGKRIRRLPITSVDLRRDRPAREQGSNKD